MTQRGGGSDAPAQATAVNLVVLSQTSPRSHGYPARMERMAVIVLNWPPRELHPNARPHFHARATAAKAYREAAYWIAKAAAQPHSHPSDGIPVRIDFYPPDRRKRDLDGMLSSIKAGIDGIADAYELNDYELNPVILSRRDPVRGGKVEVLLA